jgi:predicted NAD/FAD-binding protein
MRIAVIGAGIAGLTAALRLDARHDVTVFAADDHAGGHANTVLIEDPHAGELAVDTGFIVFNDRTYPHFRALLAELGVAARPTHMGFSVSSALDPELGDFEYGGSPAGLFAQRSNLVRPAFHRMLADVLRFNRALEREVREPSGASLTELLDRGRYGRLLAERMILPQVSAVWSADPAQLERFPAAFLARFFHNHGTLTLTNRPQWFTVVGGSHTYVKAIEARLRRPVRTRTPVASVTRHADRVELALARGGPRERFDEVVIACHSDQALALLADPSPAERAVLGAIPYQRNEAVLHTDPALLPRRPAARQAWNFHLFARPRDRTTVTYGMNHLQGLPTPTPYSVTLNLTDRIDPRRVLRVIDYAHPVYTPEGVAAQERHGEISGVNRTRYCGAYWRWGFHEDGVWSALRAIDGLTDSATGVDAPAPRLEAAA